jgi:hypothetical protein
MKWLLLILSLSCSHSYKKEFTEIKESTLVYSYQDGSGQFKLTREIKKHDKKVILRQQILDKSLKKNDFLEKSIVVIQPGKNKKSKSQAKMIRPLDSQYIVWLEGKKYESRGKLLLQKKKYAFQLESPEAKWNGYKEYEVPQGNIFCFLSILPECLKSSGSFSQVIRNPNKKVSFYVVWEGFPFISEQFSGMSKEPMNQAELSYDKYHDGTHRFTVDIGGQSIFYHLTNDLNFIRMFWASQGISIMPLDEVID